MSSAKASTRSAQGSKEGGDIECGISRVIDPQFHAHRAQTKGEIRLGVRQEVSMSCFS